MITFDTTTLIILAVLLLMSILTPMVNIFFRKVSDTPPGLQSEGDLPPVTILLTVHEQAHELKRHLPSLLAQDYPAGYEVIVVVSKGEDGTDDILKQFMATHKNLYATFIPDSSRYMSRKKLAVTLGVKAAKNEWILMTEPSCEPASDQWLRHMASHCDEEHDMVMGYGNFDDEASHYKRFLTAHTMRYLLREARRGTAYRAEAGNLMFRKSLFMQGRGFEGNLKYIRGEYDFIVNKCATRGRTAVETSPESWMIADNPATKQWRDHHLYYMETRRHLLRSHRHRAPYNTDQALMHANYLLILAVMAWVPAIAAGALAVTLTLRILIARKALHQFGEHIPAWKIIPNECSLAWRSLLYRLRYRSTDKYDFISHKI